MTQTDTLLAAIGALAVLTAALLVWQVLRVRALQRDILLVRNASDERSLVGSVAAQIRSVDALRRQLADFQEELIVAQRDINASLRHAAVVRYDAFGDMGGRLSFSMALLDDNGDGLLLTSIHGHTESRMYVKTVTRHAVEGRISPEELEAIQTARPIRG